MLMWQRGPHTRRCSLYASWVADSDFLVILLSSYDAYSYLYQKDHRTASIYIYKKVRKGLDEKCDVPNANASLYSTKRIDQATHYTSHTTKDNNTNRSLLTENLSEIYRYSHLQ